MSRTLFLASLTLAALLALLISAMNAGRVGIELAFGHFYAPLGLALVIAFVIGLVTGLMWRVYWVQELLNERGRLRRALRSAEARARTAVAAQDAG